MECGIGRRYRAWNNQRMQAGGSGGGSSRPRRQKIKAALTVVAIVLAVVVYYELPVPGRMRGSSWAYLFCGGLVVLGTLISLTVVRLLRAGPEHRARTLILLLCISVLFFSYADVVLAKQPGQFVDLHTKTDAVYFSVSTLATVGFGDVHAGGQLARAAITIEILFNLVFIGMAIAMISGILRAQARSRLAGGSNRPPDSGGQGG